MVRDCHFCLWAILSLLLLVGSYPVINGIKTISKLASDYVIKYFGTLKRHKGADTVICCVDDVRNLVSYVIVQRNIKTCACLIWDAGEWLGCSRWT